MAICIANAPPSPRDAQYQALQHDVVVDAPDAQNVRGPVRPWENA
jgi:hypothetical protein